MSPTNPRTIIDKQSRFLNDAAMQGAANRSEAAGLLGSVTRMSGKLRRALRFLMGTPVATAPRPPKHPLLKLEQQLRGKNARQLIVMRRREQEDIKAAYKQLKNSPSPNSAGIFSFIEHRLNLIEIEMRRRGIITGD